MDPRDMYDKAQTNDVYIPSEPLTSSVIPAGKVTFADDNFEITVTRAVKVSTGNYENTDLAVSMTRKFNTNKDQTSMFNAYTYLAGEVRNMLKYELDRVLNVKRDADPRVKKFGL